MKKYLLPALFAVAVLGAAPAASAQKNNSAKMATNAPAYAVQPQLSTLGWEAKAVTHGHNGTMNFSSGELLVKGNAIVGGTVTVDMKSMKATDITDAGKHATFVSHMSDARYFTVDKYPTATFTIVSVTPIKGAAKDANNATITGDMKIKDQTQRISFPAKVGVKDGLASATGKVTIDRTKFGITENSKATLAESMADKVIYDDIQLAFNVIAKKS
ncbi:YceI family protein [Hymenobacter monticola]|uniref:YceI family protein n=1 Tax=Hymenobacter monticola TaxID=1705399 RepID=A0ABY4B160_9BACT|nr:YceI family protein [Hymenobacter monticola]UOE32519.1 YceI family protein [Hymenobacter monticola]